MKVRKHSGNIPRYSFRGNTCLGGKADLRLFEHSKELGKDLRQFQMLFAQKFGKMYVREFAYSPDANPPDFHFHPEFEYARFVFPYMEDEPFFKQVLWISGRLRDMHENRDKHPKGGQRIK